MVSTRFTTLSMLAVAIACTYQPSSVPKRTGALCTMLRCACSPGTDVAIRKPPARMCSRGPQEVNAEMIVPSGGRSNAGLVTWTTALPSVGDGPVAPVGPAGPGGPTGPGLPGSPGGPADPAGPGTPDTPGGPGGPGAPCGPGGPASPTAPRLVSCPRQALARRMTSPFDFWQKTAAMARSSPFPTFNPRSPDTKASTVATVRKRFARLVHTGMLARCRRCATGLARLERFLREAERCALMDSGRAGAPSGLRRSTR